MRHGTCLLLAAVLTSTSRNASVRQILGRPGEVWLPGSGADKLVVIRERGL